MITRASCLVCSTDVDLIGRIVMAGFQVEYVKEREDILKKLENAYTVIVLDFAPPKDFLEKIVTNTQSKILVRGVLPTDASLNIHQFIHVPAGSTNEIMIDRLLHGESRGDTPYQGGKKVLIIEDNNDILEMYEVAFQSKGYVVEKASNGLVGITKMVQFQPTVVILDIMMPEMDGFEVLQTLRNNTTIHTKIIVNSNLEGVDEERKVRELGADYFLRKSQYTPLDVVSFIDEHVLEK